MSEKYVPKSKRGKTDETREEKEFRAACHKAFRAFLYPIDAEQMRSYRRVEEALEKIWDATPVPSEIDLNLGLAILLEELGKHTGSK